MVSVFFLFAGISKCGDREKDEKKINVNSAFFYSSTNHSTVLIILQFSVLYQNNYYFNILHRFGLYQLMWSDDVSGTLVDRILFPEKNL